MKHLSKDDIEEILILSKTLSQNKIAKLFNKTQGNISIILKNNNIKYDNTNINLGKLSINIDYFKKINSKEKAYWLGYIYADGTITKNNNKISLVSKDLEVIENFKKSIKSNHKITKNINFDKRTNKKYTSYLIQIGNRMFVRNLINLGITNKKTDILYFPIIDEKYYSYFIAGLFDGDGCISYYGKHNLRMSLISTNEVLSFIKDYIAKKFNIKDLQYYKKVSTNKTNVYKMHLYKDTFKFLQFIYNDNNFKYYLKRKYNIYKEFTKKKNTNNYD